MGDLLTIILNSGAWETQEFGVSALQVLGGPRSSPISSPCAVCSLPHTCGSSAQQEPCALL